jgi:glycosyltransferase involved in cell wall biosynthesis
MDGDNGDKTVGVVIPVIDEEAALPRVLRALRTVFTGPVFVVDGGSRDRTVAVATDLGATVLGEPRRGYGRVRSVRHRGRITARDGAQPSTALASYTAAHPATVGPMASVRPGTHWCTG